MIKANDLRIGNWILNAGQIPIRCTPARICDIDNNIAISSPIPLRPEILGKAGFIQDGNGNFWKDYITHYLELDIWGEECFYPVYAMLPEMSSENEQRVHLNLIKYLHQLQNLIFALTGEELQIDL